MDLTLRGALAWRHAFGDVDPTATLAFLGSSALTVAGLPIAGDAALVEAGLAQLTTLPEPRNPDLLARVAGRKEDAS